MSIVKKLYLSRKTIIEMLKDRHYSCEKQSINIMPFSQFNDLYEKKNIEKNGEIFDNNSGLLDIYSNYIGPDDKLQSKTIVKYVTLPYMVVDEDKNPEPYSPILGQSKKKAIEEIKNLIYITKKQYELNEKKDTIIFIICYGEKLEEEHLKLENKLYHIKIDIDIQIFHVNRLIFNISKHNLIPKHEKINVNEEEEKEFKTKFKIDTLEKLPHILNTDPMAKYLNLKCGDVCKITRPSKNAGEHVCYRYCEQDDNYFIDK